MLKLGCKARDQVTGFEGIITGYARYLTGCDQIAITARSEGNKIAECAWFDAGRVEAAGDGEPVVTPEALAHESGTGGPRSDSPGKH